MEKVETHRQRAFSRRWMHFAHLYSILFLLIAYISVLFCSVLFSPGFFCFLQVICAKKKSPMEKHCAAAQKRKHKDRRYMVGLNDAEHSEEHIPTTIFQLHNTHGRIHIVTCIHVFYVLPMLYTVYTHALHTV